MQSSGKAPPHFANVKQSEDFAFLAVDPPFPLARYPLKSVVSNFANFPAVVSRHIGTQPTGESTMPKMKTHKGTKKRFRLSASGKAMHRKAGTSHLAHRITTKRRRNLRGTGALAVPMEKKITIALNGYSN